MIKIKTELLLQLFTLRKSLFRGNKANPADPLEGNLCAFDGMLLLGNGEIQYAVPCEMEPEETYFIPWSKNLLDYVKFGCSKQTFATHCVMTFSDGKVELRFNDHLKTFDLEAKWDLDAMRKFWPVTSLPTDNDRGFIADREILKKISLATFYTGKDPMRPALQEVEVSSTNIAATDANVMYFCDVSVDIDYEMYVPGKLSQLLAKALHDDKETVFIDKHNYHNAVLINEELICYFVSGNHRFPQWQYVIPEKDDLLKPISVNKADMIKSLKSLKANLGKHKTVYITYKDGAIHVNTVCLRDTDDGTIENGIEVACNRSVSGGTQFIGCFNHELLVKACQSDIQNDDLQLQFNKGIMKASIVGDCLLMPVMPTIPLLTLYGRETEHPKYKENEELAKELRMARAQ